ncbi:MAG: hypothetical protein ACRYFX_08800 [Janthinobacterium lividum]
MRPTRKLFPYLSALLIGLAHLPAQAQQPAYRVRRLALPKELDYYDNQFSGLAISQGQLYLMSESRLQDKAEAKLYTVRLTDLNHQLADTTYLLPYQKLLITNMPALRAKMAAAGQRYEGLEAMLIDHDVVYLSVETDTPSTNCYLLKGHLRPAAVELDTTFLVPLPKPPAPDGSHIYNAGFEALGVAKKRLLAFFEYNSFAGPNYVYELNSKYLTNSSAPAQLAVAPLPFRITDATATKKHHFTAINFFFKGEGGDTIYRTPATDLVNGRLIRDKSGYKNYCRLLDITFKNNQFTWQPLWEFPARYEGYNWEGIAAYKRGYFLINDKYTPAKPYRTTLLYLQPAGR